jgi:ADP-ribose pyrophosphatase YjhB (NUDIX family)
VKSPKVQSKSPKAVAAADAHIEVIARGCLLDGSRVLLCENVKHGYLYLPGGHVEFTESASAALAREFLEETGERIRVGPLALVSEGSFATRKRTHHEINLVFHVEPAGRFDPAKVTSREEEVAFRWAELAAVPELDVRPLAAKAWLATLGHGPGEAVEWVSEIDQPSADHAVRR